MGIKRPEGVMSRAPFISDKPPLKVVTATVIYVSEEPVSAN